MKKLMLIIALLSVLLICSCEKEEANIQLSEHIIGLWRSWDVMDYLDQGYDLIYEFTDAGVIEAVYTSPDGVELWTPKPYRVDNINSTIYFEGTTKYFVEWSIGSDRMMFLTDQKIVYNFIKVKQYGKTEKR